MATTFFTQARSYRPERNLTMLRLVYLRVFRAEFGVGLFVADEVAGVDVTAIDPRLMLDLPAPAGVHGLGGRIGLDRLVGSGPAADYGAIVEQARLVADKRFVQGLAKQDRKEPGAIDEQIGCGSAAAGEAQSGHAVLVL